MHDKNSDQRSTNSQKVFRRLRVQITTIVTVIVAVVLIVVFAGITASEYNAKTQIISIQLGNAIEKNSTEANTSTTQPPYDVFSDKNSNSNIFNGDSWFGTNKQGLSSQSSRESNSNTSSSNGAVNGDSSTKKNDLSSNTGSNRNNGESIGSLATRIGRDSSFRAEEYFPIATYRIDYESCELLSTSGTSSATFSSESLIRATALACNNGYGFVVDHDSGLCFLKQASSSGDDYIAFTDTSSIDTPMASLVNTFIFVTLIVTIALMIVAWIASGWIVEPARDAWRKQTRFIADASHELKTPISVIIANSSLILEKNDIDDETKKWTSTTLEEANNLKNLVADMLYLATNEDEKGKEREELDLGHELTRVAMQFETRAFERMNEIDYSDIDDNVKVLAERQGLNRVFSILLDNACKYSDPNTRISVSMNRSKRNAVIEITDIGTGIPSGDEESVFDRFFRADKSRTRENSYGLGLAMARDIVLKHNGTIKASTASDGKTTTFTIILPVMPNTKSKKHN